MKHTSIIVNNIARHNHNKYNHNGITKADKHIKHIINYCTEINDYSKEPLNTEEIL